MFDCSPADVCTNADGYQLYPYEPCYTYVQCQSKEARFVTCQNGYCFNLTSQNCSVPAPGETI
ncbi:MAG: hypothetical protein LGB62_07310 [Sulfurovum sp.]|nr:hypothetical protein [Sulfurovum sp.]